MKGIILAAMAFALLTGTIYAREHKGPDWRNKHNDAPPEATSSQEPTAMQVPTIFPTTEPLYDGWITEMPPPPATTKPTFSPTQKPTPITAKTHQISTPTAGELMIGFGILAIITYASYQGALRKVDKKVQNLMKKFQK